jgi:acyl dehydratase
MISAVLGTKLPGPGAIFMSQNCKFLRPVYIGDEVTATVTVAALREDKPIVVFETYCANQHGQWLIEGAAVLLYEPV